MAVGKFWPGSARASCATSFLVENDRSGPKDIAGSRWPDGARLSVEVKLGSLSRQNPIFAGFPNVERELPRSICGKFGIRPAVKLQAESLFEAAVRGLHPDWNPRGSVENRPTGVTSKPANVWPRTYPYLSWFLLIRQVCFGSPAPWAAL